MRDKLTLLNMISFLLRAKVGDTIALIHPLGNFVLEYKGSPRKKKEKPMVFIDDAEAVDTEIWEGLIKELKE